MKRNGILLIVVTLLLIPAVLLASKTYTVYTHEQLHASDCVSLGGNATVTYNTTNIIRDALFLMPTSANYTALLEETHVGNAAHVDAFTNCKLPQDTVTVLRFNELSRARDDNGNYTAHKTAELAVQGVLFATLIGMFFYALYKFGD